MFWETIQVNPGVYGDRQTRFFAYWTVSFCQTACSANFVFALNQHPQLVYKSLYKPLAKAFSISRA